MLKRMLMWIRRWTFNLFPPYFGTGARVLRISPDWREVTVKLPLSVRTRNIVGTTFGGSMYAAVDPVYMMMLIRLLGPSYIVWDKAACIRFLKPGRGTLFAVFRIDETELDAIRMALDSRHSIDRSYHVDLVDAAGIVHASVEKTVYIRRRHEAATPVAA
ncbi:MAG: DUF4442 domain-containing protein [Nitrospiraceae bacterium]|nr:DUF4442 domain-containing protein [Nitrospiraceae bacterium]